MGDFPDHAKDLWSCFQLNRCINLAKAKRFHGTLLTFWAVDDTFYFSYFQLLHIETPGGIVALSNVLKEILSVKNLFQCNGPGFRNVNWLTQHTQGLESSFYHIVWIG